MTMIDTTPTIKNDTIPLDVIAPKKMTFNQWCNKQHYLLSTVIKFFVLLFGGIVITAGIAMLILPGPGLLTIFLGLSIIGSISPKVKKLLDNITEKTKQLFKKITIKHRTHKTQKLNKKH